MKKRLFDIVIPSYRRPIKILKCIDSLSNSIIQNNSDAQIFVVEDGNYYSEELIKGIEMVPQGHFFRIKKSGPSAARNFGAGKTECDFILFIDDDCVVPVNYILKLIEILQTKISDSILAFGGSIKPLDCNSKRAIGKYLSKTKHLDGPIYSNGKIVNIAGANLCIRESTFKDLNGFQNLKFNHAGGEDQYLISQIASIGMISFFDELTLFHNHEISIIQFIRKFYNYGYGVAINKVENPDYYELDSIYFPIEFKTLKTITSIKKIFNQAFHRNKTFHIETNPIDFFLSLIQEISFQYGFSYYKIRN